MNFCSVKDILDACDEPVWSPDNFSIQLKLIRGTIRFDALRELETYELFASGFTHATDLTLQANYDAQSAGELPTDTTVTLRLPRVVSRSVVAKDLADLLSLPSATWQAPQNYFLVKEEESGKSFCFTEPSVLQTAPSRVQRYHDALSLWTLLRSQADHSTETESIVFFGIRRIEIEPKYSLADLNEDIPANQILKFVNEANPQNTQKEIFRSVLSEFLRDLKSDRAFSYLLARSSLFTRRLSEGLAIYMSEHSPEKLAQVAVAKHFELAEKLETVITGMETKSLTIPVAILLAVKEVKFGEGWETLNTIIVISATLYLIAMTVAHFSQRSMLHLLKTTIADSTAELREQGLSETNEVLTESFQTLRQRRRNSNVGTWLMWAFSAAPLIAVIYAAFLAPIPKPPEPKPLPVRILPAN